MKLNDFDVDLEYSLETRGSELFDEFYHKVFPGISYIEPVEDMERQRKGIDKVIHFKSGNEVTVDEKKRRVDYGDILLELWSVLDKRVRGWLYTCQCDHIVYAIMPAQKVYLLPSTILKRAWFTNKEAWLSKYKQHDALNDGYVTRNIAIPTQVLLDAIKSEMEHDLVVSDS